MNACRFPGRSLTCVALACAAAVAARAQSAKGELRLAVRDAANLPLQASGELVSQAHQYKRAFSTDREGNLSLPGLPFGSYYLHVKKEGFSPFNQLVQIQSEVPLFLNVELGIGIIETTVQVTDADTLLDVSRTATNYYLSSERLQEGRASAPGRAALELVQSQPGWLLEANGVLHPRGAEYNTQYVVDGVPILDNRSPAFAPEIETEDLESMNVLTAGYSAEYGRKLGGIVEVETARDRQPGLHLSSTVGAGSFHTRSGYVSTQYTRGPISASLAGEAAHTKRFLDPPVEENYSNKFSSAGWVARFDADVTEQDRLHAYVHSRRAGFLVPNEAAQQEAGQRQDRRNQETMGKIAYQRILSAESLLSLRGMTRDLSAALWSNPFATPILANQDRGFREGYLAGTVSVHRGRHDLKLGVDSILTALWERFAYDLADREFFDSDVPGIFRFSDSRTGVQHAAFAHNVFRLGEFTISAGLRWDRYRLLVRDQAISPRLGLSYYWPAAGLVFRAAYDRAFETPPLENLLFASSRAAQTLAEHSTGLPVPASWGNFYQVGFAKSLRGRLRIDGSYFRRQIRNFSDDDVLLNTGVSFPIAFAGAEIHGFEGRLELPRWHRWSGFVSYSNLVGTGRLPITGGLLLEGNIDELLHSTDRFPITQDQRNTMHAQLRCQLSSRAWMGFAARYGSGLPVELESEVNPRELSDRFSARILDSVDFARGRVRPQFSLDGSVGVELWKTERASMGLQADVINMTDRLNVINFAGLFSGTALGPPRSFHFRLRTEF